MQQKFWITRFRTTLKSIVTKCEICRFQRIKPENPRMANLPEPRLAYHVRPFTHCGVDYFGPMLITVSRKRQKRWGALFTCMSTRTIHLKLVHTLSSDSTIMALRRLIARRGQPNVIYSDNGTNFRGTANELKEAIIKMGTQDHIKFALENHLKWRFTPPDTPHMGGVWERLIR